MNKFEFISHILENQKMNLVQKERFLKLASKEIGIVKPSNEELWREIEKIKKQLATQDKSPDQITILEPDDNVVEVLKPESFKKTDVDAITGQEAWGGLNIEHIKSFREKKKVPDPNPKHVADFMSLFNQREGLKYLTHDFDENSEFEIDKFLISANDVFKKETQKLNIPPSLWKIVKQFAFDSKQTAWTSISEDYKTDIPIKLGWATPELRNWSKQNHLHPIRNEEYKKIIKDFKRITRIETSNLEKLIDATLQGAFENELGNFEIKKVDLSKADFYSHVRFLKDAFKTIFEEIKKRSDSLKKKEITIKYERAISDDGYYLRRILITHHNSFPNKEQSLVLKEWNEYKGSIGKIEGKLKGYCHWSVETMIDDIPIKVNILKDKEIPEYEIIKCETDELPEGFTHILTFYYK